MAENSMLLSRADSAVLSHDYALAARLYSTLLKENPEDKKLLSRLGNVYIKSGEDEKALPVFQKIREANPQDAELLLTLGGIYRRIKKYDESIKVLDEALEAGAKREQAYYNLGFTYKFMGEYEKAIDCFETVVTLNTSDVLAYNHLGTIYALKKNHEAAIRSYQKGLKVDSNHPILHLNLAKTYDASGNVSGALHEYEAALRYKPGWDEAYLCYTALLLKIGKIREAESLAEQGVSLNSNNARLQTILGDIYMAQSDYENAEKKYSTSIQIENDHADTLKGLARSLEAQGKNSEAIDTIQKARQLSPDDERLIKQSASINLSGQKFAAASRDIKELFERDKDDVETLDLAGQYYICTDDEERAKKVYKKIEAADPEYNSHLSNASKRYKQKGNLQKAENYISKYLEKKPADAKALVSLAMIEEKLGKNEAALENYNKALEKDTLNRFAKASSARLEKVVTAQRAAEESQRQKEAEAEAQKNLPEEFNMGEEEGGEVSENVESEAVFSEDDFDFDAFGKSPLLDSEEEKGIDFESFAETHEIAEENEEKPFEENLVEEENSRKSEIPKVEIPSEENSSSQMEEDFGQTEDAPKNPPYSEPVPPPAQPPKIDTSALEEQMARLAQNAQNALNAAALAANNAQSDEARRLAEENARLKAEQAEAARRAAEETARRLSEQQEQARREAEEAARKLAEQKAELEEAAKKLQEEKEAARIQAEELRAAKEEAEKAAALAAEKAALAQDAAEKEAETQTEDAGLDAASEGDDALESESEIAKESEENFSEQNSDEEIPEEKNSFQTAEDSENSFGDAVQKIKGLIPAIENILRDGGGGRNFDSEIKLFKTLRALSESLPEKERHEFLQSKMRVTLDYLISALEGEPGLLKTSVALRKSGVLSDAVPEDAVNTDYPLPQLTRLVASDMKTLSGGLEEEDLKIALSNLADEVIVNS